jgi:hypothetical protein
MRAARATVSRDLSEIHESHSRLSLLHEAGFQADCLAVHLAINIMVAIHEADGFGLRSTFEHLVAAAQFQILDQDDKVAVREQLAKMEAALQK